MKREEVTDWEIVGSGTPNDPLRPNVFPESVSEDGVEIDALDQAYHFDAKEEKLYKLVPEDTE